jgi:hypothetical protein
MGSSPADSRKTSSESASSRPRPRSVKSQAPLPGTPGRMGGYEGRLLIAPLQDDITGVKLPLFAVPGAVVLVLAIACVNVTNLLLARGVRRRRFTPARGARGEPAAPGPATADRELLLASVGGLAECRRDTRVRALVAQPGRTPPRK